MQGSAGSGTGQRYFDSLLVFKLSTCEHNVTILASLKISLPLQILFVAGTGKSKKKRKQRSETEQTKGKKNRPNYFIGIQIKKPEILGKVIVFLRTMVT